MTYVNRWRVPRSEEHTSELQSRLHLVCRLLREKKKMVTAFEVLMATKAARNLVREGKTNQLRNVMTTGQRDGIQTLDTSLGLLIHFFFNATATTEIYTLSLHDALPI